MRHILFNQRVLFLLLRESVATFLTRGDLWISWVQGKDTFEELLLDFETSICCGCWMRSSCSAFFTGEGRSRAALVKLNSEGGGAATQLVLDSSTVQLSDP